MHTYHVHTPQKIAIYTYSLSTTQRLDRPNCIAFSEHLTTKLLNLYENCASNNVEITLIWIPSHTGIVGNENVDFWLNVA